MCLCTPSCRILVPPAAVCWVCSWFSCHSNEFWVSFICLYIGTKINYLLKVSSHHKIFVIYLPENKGAEYRFFLPTSFSVLIGNSILCVGVRKSLVIQVQGYPKHGDTHMGPVVSSLFSLNGG